MKSFTSIILLVAFSTIAISGAMPRDITPASTSTIESSLANASPPPASLAHPLSLLYPRAKENQDVHTRVVSSSYQKCTKAFIDCTKTCHGSSCQRICLSVHADGKPCKKTCGWP
ncbi:hypothetical protein AA0119_g6268 [Alternaria tenuissima]|uniref:Uncharacterized protein n=1 Tax=Alternaria tenuissima TaxID=119927 RepID=A0ABY0GBJ0_9PLEO|nr:hypothetical protein AA0119_g6268 [Alternaria tenuissima]RYO11781.1 hypothetical protein AA0121_g9665 [Alternaria tenuissima]RYO62269.1 hypothetical protein AA0116_g4200 [Alternaria tenuissima]